MSALKYRLYAAGIHFSISLAIAILAALLVFFLWYPYPYRELSGGRELFLLIVAVDLVIGPLITIIIFNRAKTRRHLVTDFTVVGLLQVAALSYGLWTVFEARPVHLVFEYHRMAVVHAADIEPGALARAPVGLRNLPVTGPTLLSLRALRGAEEQFNSVVRALGGVAQAAQPSLWQPYEAARPEILQESQPVARLRERFPGQADVIDRAVAETGRPISRLRYLPLLSRRLAWTMLLDDVSAQPVGFIPLDSF